MGLSLPTSMVALAAAFLFLLCPAKVYGFLWPSPISSSSSFFLPKGVSFPRAWNDKPQKKQGHHHHHHHHPISRFARTENEAGSSSSSEGSIASNGASGAIQLKEDIRALLKQKKFKHLPDDVIQVTPRNTNNDEATDNESSTDKDNEDMVSINTIVLRVLSSSGGGGGSSSETILVILSQDDKIDMNKLREYLKTKKEGVESIDLASPDEVESLVGYNPGCVPPFGHRDRTTTAPSGGGGGGERKVYTTIINEPLIQNTPRRKLLGGGGSEDYQCLVRLGAFVGMDHVEIANISQKDISGGDSMDGEDDELLVNAPPPRTISLPPWGSTVRPKPLFPVETPNMEEAKSLLLRTNEEESNGDMSIATSSSTTTWVTLVGIVGSVRRMSKRLVFCDLLPPGYKDEEDDEDEEEQQPTSINGDEGEDDEGSPFGKKEWRGSDGQEISVQLIGGKTLCQAMGEVHGQATLKRLQPGQWVLVQAKLNLYISRDSLESWVSHRRLDLVMVSYQKLYDKPPPPPPAVTAAQAIATPQSNNNKPNKPYLRWEDVFGPGAAGVDPLDYITLIDNLDAVKNFSMDVAELCRSLEAAGTAPAPVGNNQQNDILVNGNTKNNNNNSSENERTPINGDDKPSTTNTNTCSHVFVGIDCEWKPGFYLDAPHEQQPVLVLQISIHHRVYLFDLQLLARPLQTVDETMTPLEKELNDALAKVFSSKVFLKVGFQLLQDLQKLAVSYPHIPAFQEVFGVLEASTLATKVMRFNRQKNSRLVTSSLNRLTEHFVNRSVNKEQQVSDWSQRPLTREQMEYAALDAAITPTLVQQFFDTLDLSVLWPGPEVGRWKGDAPYSKILASFKFLFLQPDTDAHVVKKLKAKTVLSNQPLMVVTQMWNTAEDPPKLPSVPVDEKDGPYTDVFGIIRVPSTTVPIRPPKQTREEQDSYISSLIGQRTGKSKEKCLIALLSGTLNDLPETLPEGSRLEYPPRSGYVEFEDGLALFVNMPERISETGGGIGQPRSYPNEWLEDGKVLTWFVRDYEWLSGTTPLAKKLLDPKSLVVLFVRVTSKNFFLCCGPITVEEPETKTDIVSKEKSWYLVQLNLNLLGWEKLSQTEEFLSLVT